MANSLFDWGRDAFLNGAIDWTVDTINVALVTSAYTPDLANHKFLSDLGGDTVGTDQTIGSTSSAAGVANGAGVTWTAVPSGSTVKALVIYKSTGVAGTSRLIAYLDTDVGGLLPLATNGGNISATWDTGANKIFKL